MSLLIKDLTKKFDEHVAVNNLNIDIPKGEIFGFLDGNGAGKTNTFRIILDFYRNQAEHFMEW